MKNIGVLLLTVLITSLTLPLNGAQEAVDNTQEIPENPPYDVLYADIEEKVIASNEEDKPYTTYTETCDLEGNIAREIHRGSGISTMTIYKFKDGSFYLPLALNEPISYRRFQLKQGNEWHTDKETWKISIVSNEQRKSLFRAERND